MKLHIYNMSINILKYNVDGIDNDYTWHVVRSRYHISRDIPLRDKSQTAPNHKQESLCSLRLTPMHN